MPQKYQKLARYNAKMNSRFCKLASGLSDSELLDNRGTFFGSIFGTLNHILVGDIIWLNRFKLHPVGFLCTPKLDDFKRPRALNELLYPDLPSYCDARRRMDDLIIDLSNELTPEHLGEDLAYKNTKGESFCRNFEMLLTHLFNHQTHHRGQLSTLFNQLHVDVGVTDFLIFID